MLVSKPVGKYSLGRYRRNGIDSIKMNFGKTGSEVGR
jgi:hypothetical protein